MAAFVAIIKSEERVRVMADSEAQAIELMKGNYFGNVKIHTLKRLDSFIAAVANKRLTYEQLIAEV